MNLTPPFCFEKPQPLVLATPTGGCKVAASRVFLWSLAVQQQRARLFHEGLPVVEEPGSYKLQEAGARLCSRSLLRSQRTGTCYAEGQRHAVV